MEQNRDGSNPVKAEKKFFVCIIVGILVILGVYVYTIFHLIVTNFKQVLTNNTLSMLEMSLQQGVSIVENELAAGSREISLLAASFSPDDIDAGLAFAGSIFKDTSYIRAFFITPTKAHSSDGQSIDTAEPDIMAALSGSSAIHGPYYNDRGEFVIRWSTPVYQDGSIAGVMAIEKDGYMFTKLIKDIRFMQTGEAYIINAEGTDIAVSDLSHLDWVTTEYNAQKLVEEAGGEVDDETLSILRAEQKVLAGETGIDTYYWNDGLCYILYAPIQPVGWGLIGGLRDEEFDKMALANMRLIVTDTPSFFVLPAITIIIFVGIICWAGHIIKVRKKMNSHLENLCMEDSLTGLMNRRILEQRMFTQWHFPNRERESAAIFMIDIDHFKKYNDFYGHQQGDHCLQTVATILKNACTGDNFIVVRYGGEEFLVIAFLLDRHQARELGERLVRLVEEAAMPNHADGVVTISVGVCHISTDSKMNFKQALSIADKHLYMAKERGRNQMVMDS